MSRAVWTTGNNNDLDIVTANAGDVLTGKTIINAEGTPLSGTMPNHGAISKKLDINSTYTIPEGYHNGNGKVSQNIATFGGQVITPTTYSQTIYCAGQFASGNVVINPIPSNYLDLTNGRVGFSMPSGFQSPLDGGFKYVPANKAWGKIQGNGIEFECPAKSNDTRVLGIYSVNLTGINIIKTHAWVYGKTWNTCCPIVCNLNKDIVTVQRKYSMFPSNPYESSGTPHCGEYILDVSSLNGHYYVGVDLESGAMRAYTKLYLYKFER